MARFLNLAALTALATFVASAAHLVHTITGGAQ